MAATVLCPELVAAASNMLAAAWAAAEIGAPAQPVPDAATGKPPAPEAREVSQDERRDQDSGRSPRADRGDLRAPVHDGPGPRPHRVHRTSVRPGRRGVAAGMAGEWHRGDRHRPGGLRALDRGPVSYTHLTLPT